MFMFSLKNLARKGLSELGTSHYMDQYGPIPSLAFKGKCDRKHLKIIHSMLRFENVACNFRPCHVK